MEVQSTKLWAFVISKKTQRTYLFWTSWTSFRKAPSDIYRRLSHAESFYYER